jgi:hypothetical protein
MIWLVLWVAVASFAFGWTFGLWLCSKERWCPHHMDKSVRKWKREVAESTKARRAAKPEQIDEEITKPLTPRKKP